MTPANPDALADALVEAHRILREHLHVISPNGSLHYVGGIQGAAEAIAPLLSDLQRVTAERDAAREEAYDLKLAAAGGEDVPGSANLVTADDVRRWRDEETRALRTAEARVAQIQAEVEAKDRALKEIAEYPETSFVPHFFAGHRRWAFAWRSNFQIVRDIARTARAATAREG